MWDNFCISGTSLKSIVIDNAFLYLMTFKFWPSNIIFSVVNDILSELANSIKISKAVSSVFVKYDGLPPIVFGSHSSARQNFCANYKLRVHWYQKLAILVVVDLGKNTMH